MQRRDRIVIRERVCSNFERPVSAAQSRRRIDKK